MNDRQFGNLLEWIGDCIGGFFSFVGSGFGDMNRTHWFIGLLVTVVVGFLCLRGLRADQRM